MNDIICPNCGQAFKIDEAGYADILKQVRDREFEQQLQERLKKGEDMTGLVKQYSDGPFGLWGGETGYVEKDKMSEIFKETLLNLEEGAYSPIIESSYGFHLFLKLPYLEEEK